MPTRATYYSTATYHLGSWTTVTDAEGNMEQELSFDAWGNLRDADTWTGSSTEAPMFDRGYTGHEHMTVFGLINMNGRCYDPMMSSFLSVDEYVQDPTCAQSFNRYAYCAYNPLKYAAPDNTNFVRPVVVPPQIFMHPNNNQPTLKPARP